MPIVDRTVSEKVTAATTLIITNGAVAGAPGLPGNDLKLGGWELNAIAFGTNALIQFGKMEKWFPDNRYARWYSLYLGVLFCTLLWGSDFTKWLLNTLTVIALIMTNYPLMNTMEVMKSATPPTILKESIPPKPTPQAPLQPTTPQGPNAKSNVNKIRLPGVRK